MQRAGFFLLFMGCGPATPEAMDAAADASVAEDAISDSTVDPSDVRRADASDAGNPCMVPSTVCMMPCPAKTFCLRKVDKFMQAKDLGCTPIPSECPNGAPSCDCMKHCFCTAANETCTEFYNVPFASLVCDRPD